MVDRSVSAGRGSLCDPNSPTAPIEFRDNPAEPNENLTPTVRNFAAGKFSRLTLQLRTHNESDTSAWKRFRNDAVLAVKYVALPAQPKDFGLVSGSGTVCSANEADPGVISDPTPAVTGRPRTASGDFQFGRYLWAGNRYYSFNGSIDEVAVWQRVLTAQEVADEARLQLFDGYAGAELVAAWDPSTGSGTTVPDAVSGYGRDLTLTGGASLDGEAIVLDGVDGAATAPGPLVDDTGSFTVTTQVERDGDVVKTKDVGCTAQVLSQRTADGASWGLWYRVTGMETVLDEETFEEKTVPVGCWYFGRPNADGTFDAVVSDEVAA